MSFMANGFVSGMQKKIKGLTASMGPTTYDFLYFPTCATGASRMSEFDPNFDQIAIARTHLR
jgi:hypothetical protein